MAIQKERLYKEIDAYFTHHIDRYEELAEQAKQEGKDGLSISIGGSATHLRMMRSELTDIVMKLDDNLSAG